MSWVEVDGDGWSWVHGLVIPIRLHNLLSMNIFFIIKYHFMVLKKIFLIIVKRKPKINKFKNLLKLKNSEFFKSNFIKHFLHNNR